MKKRYVQSTREEKGRLLDEMEAVTELHHKSLIRLMNGSLERTPRQKQRGRTYGPEISYALSVIAESFDYLCAERLTPNLVWMANQLATHGEIVVSPLLLEKLDQISVSTVQRILERIPRDKPRLPRQGPQSTPKLTQGIPMRRIPWNERQPGHFETDLVHHCGLKAFGEYVCTVQMIDVATGWSELRAVLGRSYLVMEDAFRYILARTPFPILELHPDNGSEFFNHHLLRFFRDAVQGIALSRSRPYHKNDNRFVEQKNSSLVRAYLGDDRLDTVAQTIAVNQLYDKVWVYYNLLQPVMRLAEKIVTPVEGQLATVKRRYDQARTPFDRLCETNAMTQQRREQLEALRDRTDPRRLRQEIYDLLDYLFSLPNAVPGQTENVYLTLTTHLDLEGLRLLVG
jgi:transposase InsO family protein